MAMYTLETVGQRIYFLGNTYSVKDRIQAIGATFDRRRRQWYVGTVKRAAAEALLASLNAEPAQAADQSGAQADAPYTGAVWGKATYKDNHYFVRYAGPTKRGEAFHLVTADGKRSFWVDANEAQWTKRYEKRGRFGKIDHERGSYPTLEGIQRFKDRNAREAKQTGIECWKCRQVFERGGDAGLREHLHDGCDVCGNER